MTISQNSEARGRLYNLDYLRGLAAFGIMIYHYLSWTQGTFTADTFMGRLGIYGVALFYILSGLTLFYVYYDKMTPIKTEVLSFFKKRIFRIFPLLWLVTIVSILLSRKMPDLDDLFLNLTGLFGFIKWDTYFSNGVWSIGNELVFYAFFPVFVLLTKHHKTLMLILSIIIVGLFLYFAFVAVSLRYTLGQQWRVYINPLNQVLFFWGGFLLGYLFQNKQISNRISVSVLVFSLSIFIFLPVEGDGVHLVTWINRLIFTACCFLICFSFYKMTFKFPAYIHKPLTMLGEASYSVYLLHSIVYTIVSIIIILSGKYAYLFPPLVKVTISVIGTLVLSYFVYEYFEKYFMKLAKKKEKNF